MFQAVQLCRVLFSNNSKTRKVKSVPTKRAPDAGESAQISSSFSRLFIFPVGRLRRPRPSAGNAIRWAVTSTPGRK